MLATVPVPVPATLTVSTTAFWIALKFAVTCWLALRITLQVELLPLQLPDHPAKEEFAAAASVRVTWVPLAKLALQDWPHAMPAGLAARDACRIAADRTSASTGGLNAELKGNWRRGAARHSATARKSKANQT
jgi:hypothetical protein